VIEHVLHVGQRHRVILLPWLGASFSADYE